MPTVVYEQTPAGIVAIFADRSIDDRDWDAYVAAISAGIATGKPARALVITERSAPSSSQRARLDAAIAPVRAQLKVAVVTSSTFVRGVVSAFALFVPGYRAFGMNVLEDAIAHLDARGRGAEEVRQAVMRLRAQQGAR